MSLYAEARRHMVDSQVRPNDVTDRRIQDAMARLPRETFVPRSKVAEAYGDKEVLIGEGRYMMRPRDFAKLVHAAQIDAQDLVLDIGCARGYSSAVIAALCETVVGLESDPAMVEKAIASLSEVGADNAVVVDGDVKAGLSDQGPFDVIFVNNAVDQVPQTWLDQLKDGGRLAVIVRQGPVGKATIFTRSGAAVGEKVIFDASPTVLAGFEREAGFVF
ncbi:protein-L-isoaspartate O-methyltransferase family protein [Woodsholea maritima]|uniref:protein-L-isoaspartate O-methyltransferase family protein n=1 Tax=Woodsholea maritima TaxID=240237 RepID=UPI0004776BD7|nr:protein-L-isoaspartate O-methyltransferase [Woodsholea maritima]